MGYPFHFSFIDSCSIISDLGSYTKNIIPLPNLQNRRIKNIVLGKGPRSKTHVGKYSSSSSGSYYEDRLTRASDFVKKVGRTMHREENEYGDDDDDVFDESMIPACRIILLLLSLDPGSGER